MTALTANQNVPAQIQDDFRHYPVAASTTIYKGAFVGLNTSGYAIPLEAGGIFVGIARDQVDNSSGSAGDLNVEADLRPFEYTLTSAAITDVGKLVYASDDNTLTLTNASNYACVGVVTKYVTTDTVMVDPRPAVARRGMKVKTLSATGNQTLTEHDVNCVIIAPNTEAVTETLPKAQVGDWLTIKKTTADADAVTLDGSGDDTIDGSATNNDIDAQHDTMTLVKISATAWAIVAKEIA